MKRQAIKQQQAQGSLSLALILSSPENREQWIVLFKDTTGRSYFLLTEEDEIQTFESLDAVVVDLKMLGFGHAEIRFGNASGR